MNKGYIQTAKHNKKPQVLKSLSELQTSADKLNQELDKTFTRPKFSSISEALQNAQQTGNYTQTTEGITKEEFTSFLTDLSNEPAQTPDPLKHIFSDIKIELDNLVNFHPKPAKE